VYIIYKKTIQKNYTKKLYKKMEILRGSSDKWNCPEEKSWNGISSIPAITRIITITISITIIFNRMYSTLISHPKSRYLIFNSFFLFLLFLSQNRLKSTGRK